MTSDRTVDRLLRQQAALAEFGSFAFGETDLQKILIEASRICAQSLDVPFSKICRYRPDVNDVLVVAGFGWGPGVVGCVISQADETSTQGRAFVTGEPVILEDIRLANSYRLPDFYSENCVVSTADVPIKGRNGPFGVLEVDCSKQRTFDQHDIDFLMGFANVVAEAVSTAERTVALQQALSEMQRLGDEKNVLAAELQHRVRNNLQLVHGMLIRQISLPDASARKGIKAIARRVLALARVYDHLLGHGLVQKIDFGGYLKSLCTNLREFQEVGLHEIDLICEAESMNLELDLVTTLGIVVTEITSNAYLHAFPSTSGIVRVSLTHKEDIGYLTISDNGVGFVPSSTSKRHGIGLIKRLVEQENGTADLDCENGTVWNLAFPLAGEALAKPEIVARPSV